MPTPNDDVRFLISNLPDQNGARAFLHRIEQDHPPTRKLLSRERGLLADVLALAAWSPLLATTLEQNPQYISWLHRERLNARVRTREELKESLARFALTHSSLAIPAVLARFRRRELLRTYLHDIRGIHTIVETTEELSNVADAVLDHVLNLARQDLDNLFGSPRRTDERGRVATADLSIVALGKLGSSELNYASDIDLMFLYSDEGNTSGSGERGEVTNREYFVKLAETIVKFVGQPSGEGAAYRVDLRLRPHGRDGALACSYEEAVRYYRDKAQAWERQTLIRSRAAAGSSSLYARFFGAVQKAVFRLDVPVGEALASVRLAKQKIDRYRASDVGFNVKLHRGGIREIEFIAQALQLAYGGHDEWLCAPHTLISLGRLADRDLITEDERSKLSEAYAFLRKLEHRLQMEHGLQTHNVPVGDDARRLVAMRMDFAGRNALAEFDSTLAVHTANVRNAFDRVFQEVGADVDQRDYSSTVRGQRVEGGDPEESVLKSTVRSLSRHMASLSGPENHRFEQISHVVKHEAAKSLNSQRAIRLVTRVAASMEKSTEDIELSEELLRDLVQLCGASEFFGEIMANNPALLNSLHTRGGRDYRALLRSAVDREKHYSNELSAFRLQWLKLLLEIGQADAKGKISVLESNRFQTELAIASINVAYLIARRELARRFERFVGPRIAVLGLGRLGTAGVDYGSDLDVIIVYDSLVNSPIALLTKEEAYARLAELMIAALSNVTREGYLYRVDLRLRPNGQSGPLVVSSEGFLDYAKSRADVWEWLAYVKLRAVAGDLELGRMIETHGRHAIHENARQKPAAELKQETRRVRDRLEAEKGRRIRPGELDIKYAAGGMLDVYFAARFLQLADDIPDEGEDRSTRSTLERLEAAGSLTPGDYEALAGGYGLLRAVDHQLRLIVGRSARLPGTDHVVTRDIAAKLGFGSAGELSRTIIGHMEEIRGAYERITGSGGD